MTEPKLTIIELEEEVLVVWDDDPADWVARYRKDRDFPARFWAQRMVSLYTDRERPTDEPVGQA